MEKYNKIFYAVCLAVLTFHIRESQSRSFYEDETNNNISGKSENIEDLITECACFPKTLNGIPVSKSLPSNGDHQRLVVYFYKNSETGELTFYIPSWKKQTIFPDLAFDFGDKLQTVADNEIINPFDIGNLPIIVDGTPSVSVVPVENVVTVQPDLLEAETLNNSPNSFIQEVTVSPISPDDGNEIVFVDDIKLFLDKSRHKENLKPQQDTNQPTTVTPDGTEVEIITTPSEFLNQIHENQTDQVIQTELPQEINISNLPIEGYPVIENVGKYIVPESESLVLLSETQNQNPIRVNLTNPNNTRIPNSHIDSFNSGYLPNTHLNFIRNNTVNSDKLRFDMISPYEIDTTNSNKKLNNLINIEFFPNNYKNPNWIETDQNTNNVMNPLDNNKTNLNSKIIGYLPDKYKNNNWIEMMFPSKNLNNVISSQDVDKRNPNKHLNLLYTRYKHPYWIDMTIPSKNKNNLIHLNEIDRGKLSKSTNLIEIKYLPSKYENPIFNDWFNKEKLNLSLQRPSMGHIINFHYLKSFLIKSLYENGIHFSEYGELRDSLGNILNISNLKLRPIIISDPDDYEKLKASGTCVVPYDLPYLEAVIVTLVYPPRILAIIPLDLKNIFISKTLSKITSNLCNSKNSDSNCQTHESSQIGLREKEEHESDIDDSNRDTYSTKKPVEKTKYSENFDSSNNYPYVAPDKYNGSQKILNLTPPTNAAGTSNDGIEYINNFKNFGKGTRRPFKNNNIIVDNEHSNVHAPEGISDEKIGDNGNIYTDDYMVGNSVPIEAESNKASLSDPKTYDGQYVNEQVPTAITSECGSKHCQPPNDMVSKIYNYKMADPNLLKEFSSYIKDNSQYPSFVSSRGPGHIWTIMKGLQDSQDLAKKPDEGDYDDLGIRIIGGNPATSSGTPVSSKGR